MEIRSQDDVPAGRGTLAGYAAVPRGRLHHHVVRELAAAILGEQLHPGTPLPREADLAARFGVSRTVIREAVMALTQKGLLVVRHGAGTYVTNPARWDPLDPLLLEVMEETGAVRLFLEDLLDVRRMVETEAAALAAERARADDLQSLRDLYARMAHPAITPDAYLEADIAFHQALLGASHNQVLRRLAEPLRGLLRLLMTLRVRALGPDVPPDSLAGHAAILAAVEQQDPEAARAAMRRHLAGPAEALRRVLSARS